MHVEGENSHGISIPSVATLDNTRNNNETLLILYFNARSLIPKLDELCALIEIHNPDDISIVESWLCADIPDNEISIHGYHVLRKDRNRHVCLVHIDIFVFRELPVDHCNNLEILPIEIRFLSISFLSQFFYCPPNSQSFIFDALCNSLASLHIYQFSHFCTDW